MKTLNKMPYKPSFSINKGHYPHKLPDLWNHEKFFN